MGDAWTSRIKNPTYPCWLTFDEEMPLQNGRTQLIEQAYTFFFIISIQSLVKLCDLDIVWISTVLQMAVVGREMKR